MLGQYQPLSTYQLPSAPILTVPILNLPVSVAEKALESLSSPPSFGGNERCIISFSCCYGLNLEENAIKQQFSFYPHPFLFIFCPSCSISLSSILPAFRFHAVFLPVPFSSSLLFRYIHSTCAQLSLSPHSTFCFPLLPSNTYFLFSRFHI
jgi:hypothetical protein